MLCFLTPHFQTRCGLAVLLFLEPRETESPPSPKTAQGPCLPPEGPFWPVSTPGGGTTRPRPVRGRFGPHRAQFGRKKRKQSSPESSPPAQTANMPAFDFPPGARFPQKPAVERGVKKEQVKGPGSPEASRAGSLRPAEPSVTGFLPGVNFPRFPGSVWRPWGHDRGQKHEISR